MHKNELGSRNGFNFTVFQLEGKENIKKKLTYLAYMLSDNNLCALEQQPDTLSGPT